MSKKNVLSFLFYFGTGVLLILIVIFLVRKGTFSPGADDEPAFSSHEECLEFVDSTYSFTWEEEWKRWGLLYYYCESNEITAEDREFICENEGDLLSLFPSYFDENFASEGEMETAKTVAGLLTGYILEHYDEDTLKTCKASDYINEWLSTTDLYMTYEDPFADNIQRYEFEKDSYYSFVAITERGEYIYFQPLKYFIESPFEVRQFLSYFIEGTDAYLTYLEKEAPVSYPTILSLIPPKVEIYFDEKTSGYAYRTHMSLQNTPQVFHELTHIWLYSRTKEPWQKEGIAMILPILAFPEDPLGRGLNYEGFQKVLNRLEETHSYNSVEPGSYDELSIDVICLYISQYGLPETPEDVDYHLIAECFAKVQYLYMYEGGHGEPISQIGKGTNLTNGNKLTYYQAACFVDYLIQKEGLDYYLQSFLNNVSLKEAYGQSYPFLEKEFKEQFLDLDYQQLKESIESVKDLYSQKER